MKASMIGLALAAGLATGAQAAVISMSLIQTIDTTSTSNSANAEYVGNNVSAIAWNGSSLYVGGYVSAAGNTGISRYNGGVWSAAFGVAATAQGSRGFTGLAVKGNTLAAGWDGGANSVNSVRAFNATTGAQNWATGGGTPDATRRASGGANFDPGFNGAGTNQGVSYLALGSGRRHLEDTTTGNYINGQNAGAIINFTPAGTTWRGHAFDSATGDLYTRESNRVGKAVRNGDNSFATISGAQSNVIYSTVVASGVDNQNIAFASTTAYGNLIFLNDRSSAANGQAFASVIKCIDTTGAVQTLNLGAFSALNGNGAYSFSFDAGTQTLAISDFANRAVYIFAVPAPGATAMLGLAGLIAGRRRRS